MSGRRGIVVIGGGFAGAMAAVLLSRRAHEPLDVTVVEPRPAAGGGVAHSTPEPDHRLNGPDTIHSPYPDDPGHFAAWMRDSGALRDDPAALAPSGLVFARRGDYGRYVGAQFAEHARANPSGSRLDHLRRAAVRLRPAGPGVEVTLADGSTLRADRCVLALGWNAVSVPRELSALTGHPGWVGDPWELDRLSGIAPDAPVLVVGTGLTASDTYAALVARGHRGPVLALSRRGLRPGTQNPYRSSLPFWQRVTDPEPDFVRRNGRPKTVREAMRILRRELAEVDPERSSWHTPFDELRDAAWLFWPDWPDDEKRRYVRHAKGWYDTFRFRNPPQVERIVDAGLASGQLVFAAGRLRGARPAGESLEVDYDARTDGARRTVRVAAVVNCTGPQPRPSASSNPLWRAMLADGVARDAPSGLGVDVDARSRVLDARGVAHAAIHAIGPPTVGRFGEVTAAVYIVRQLVDVCTELAGDPGRSPDAG